MRTLLHACDPLVLITATRGCVPRGTGHHQSLLNELVEGIEGGVVDADAVRAAIARGVNINADDVRSAHCSAAP